MTASSFKALMEEARKEAEVCCLNDYCSSTSLPDMTTLSFDSLVAEAREELGHAALILADETKNGWCSQ